MKEGIFLQTDIHKESLQGGLHIVHPGFVDVARGFQPQGFGLRTNEADFVSLQTRQQLLHQSDFRR